MFGSKREKEQELRIARLEDRLAYLEAEVIRLNELCVPKRAPRKKA